MLKIFPFILTKKFKKDKRKKANKIFAKG